jgi:hypothetical protein
LNEPIAWALKEWQSAIAALESGETIMLLRKGGIHERQFDLRNAQMCLYPTYEHQRPELLKSQYRHFVQPPIHGQHLCTSVAQVTHHHQIHRSSQLRALEPLHIWTPDTIELRFAGQPQNPMHVLLLRAFSLPEPMDLPQVDRHRGCQSWVELDRDIILGTNLTPALDEQTYATQVSRIESVLN